jgi:DNA-binding Lrp family transcriptional regulator
MPPLDDTDRKILNRIQSDFPIDRHPYRLLAAELELEEEEILRRVAHLKDAGIIRRIGGNFAPEKLGFASTLCAARVPQDKMALFTRTVNRFPGVTHNYQRDNRYNVWFTFIAPSMEEIAANLEQIRRDTGVDDILNLPATQVYKIKAHFKL